MGIDLALLFHCSPYEFIDRDAHEVADLYKRVGKRLAERRRDSQ